MTVLEAIAQRRAVRAYEPDAVSEHTVRTLLDAAIRAPTAMHAEPWAFVVIQDRKLLKAFSEQAKHAWSPPQDGSFAVGTSHRLSEEDRATAVMTAVDYDIFHGAGTLILICAHSHGNFVSADCWLAAENLMLAATSLGLGTCPIGFSLPFFNQAGTKAELGIPLDVKVAVPIVLGVPQTAPLPSSRKPPEIISWRE